MQTLSDQNSPNEVKYKVEPWELSVEEGSQSNINSIAIQNTLSTTKQSPNVYQGSVRAIYVKSKQPSPIKMHRIQSLERKMNFHFPSINKIQQQAAYMTSMNNSKDNIDQTETTNKKKKKRNIIIFKNKKGIKSIKINKELNNVNQKMQENKATHASEMSKRFSSMHPFSQTQIKKLKQTKLASVFSQKQLNQEQIPFTLPTQIHIQDDNDIIFTEEVQKYKKQRHISNQIQLEKVQPNVRPTIFTPKQIRSILNSSESTYSSKVPPKFNPNLRSTYDFQTTLSKLNYINPSIYSTKKHSIPRSIITHDNFFTLVNNRFLEMSDIHLELTNKILEAKHHYLTEKNQPGSSNVFDLNEGKWTTKLQVLSPEFMTEDIKINFNSFTIEGVKPSDNGVFNKIDKAYIPFKFMPLLYFLSLDDLEEVLTQVIDVDEINNIKINENKLTLLLNTLLPAKFKKENACVYFKQVLTSPNSQKQVNFLKVRLPSFLWVEDLQVRHYTMKIKDMHELIFKYKIQNWAQFVKEKMEIINENLDLQINRTLSSDNSLKKELHLITKYKTSQNSYTVFLRPLKIELQLIKNQKYEIISFYEVPFNMLKVIQRYLKSQNYNQNQLIKRLIEIVEITKDKEKKLYLMNFDFSKLEVKNNQQKSERQIQESSTGVPQIILDHGRKVKMEIKNAVIKYVSNKQKNKIFQKELGVSDLTQIVELNFENWEQNLFNVHHLM